MSQSPPEIRFFGKLSPPVVMGAMLYKERGVFACILIEGSPEKPSRARSRACLGKQTASKISRFN